MTETFKIEDGGWVINPSTGRPVMLADGQKLRQDIRENLSIAAQGNGFGAGLDDLIGQVLDQFTFSAEAMRYIRASIDAMQRLQDQFRAVYRPLNERIVGISALRVAEDLSKDGKTQFAFSLGVSTASGQTVGASGVIR